jgi:hypothetical protein
MDCPNPWLSCWPPVTQRGGYGVLSSGNAVAVVDRNRGQNGANIARVSPMRLQSDVRVERRYFEAGKRLAMRCQDGSNVKQISFGWIRVLPGELLKIYEPTGSPS